MAKRLHTNEIAQQIIALIKAEHDDQAGKPDTYLGLKVIAEGSLHDLPAPEQLLASWVPAVLVIPGRVGLPQAARLGEQGPMPGGLRYVYEFQVVYLRQIAAGEQIVKETVRQAEMIAETLISNDDLGGLVLTNGQIEDAVVTQVGFTDEISDFFRAIEIDVAAATILFEVAVKTRR